MKVTRPRWGTKQRPERIVFQAPVGTRRTLERLTMELTVVDQHSTQVSDTVNAILNANRDFQRVQRKVQKEVHDTNESNNEESRTSTKD